MAARSDLPAYGIRIDHISLGIAETASVIGTDAAQLAGKRRAQCADVIKGTTALRAGRPGFSDGIAGERFGLHMRRTSVQADSSGPDPACKTARGRHWLIWKNCRVRLKSLSRSRLGIHLGIHLTCIAGQMNGAVGENRTHDLSLTKGLRYHYATTATVVFCGP